MIVFACIACLLLLHLLSRAHHVLPQLEKILLGHDSIQDNQAITVKQLQRPLKVGATPFAGLGGREGVVQLLPLAGYRR
jgi:hypothetical protein